MKQICCNRTIEQKFRFLQTRLDLEQFLTIEIFEVRYKFYLFSKILTFTGFIQEAVNQSCQSIDL